MTILSNIWHYILDENNNIIPTKDYEVIGKFYEDKRRIIRRTYIRNKRISTVMLCLDHDYEWEMSELISGRNQYAPNPHPIVFETMIFADGVWSDIFGDRYRTYKEALAGHREAVRMVIKEFRENKE